MSKININGYDITIINQNEQEYICLSEMVGGHEDGTKLIERWMNTKNTVDFLGSGSNFTIRNYCRTNLKLSEKKLALPVFSYQQKNG